MFWLYIHFNVRQHLELDRVSNPSLLHLKVTFGWSLALISIKLIWLKFEFSARRNVLARPSISWQENPTDNQESDEELMSQCRFFGTSRGCSRGPTD